jgi:hypothetical protein
MAEVERFEDLNAGKHQENWLDWFLMCVNLVSWLKTLILEVN